MVTTITYRPSLVKIDERNFEFLVTDPHTHKQTIVITTHCATASAQCKEKKTQMQKHRAKVFAMPAWVSRLLLAKLIIVVNASSWLVTSHQASSSSHGITTKPNQRCQPRTCQLQTVTAFNWNGSILTTPEPTWGHTTYNLLLLSSSSSTSCLAMGPQPLLGRIIQIGQHLPMLSKRSDWYVFSLRLNVTVYQSNLYENVVTFVVAIVNVVGDICVKCFRFCISCRDFSCTEATTVNNSVTINALDVSWRCTLQINILFTYLLTIAAVDTTSLPLLLPLLLLLLLLHYHYHYDHNHDHYNYHYYY